MFVIWGSCLFGILPNWAVLIAYGVLIPFIWLWWQQFRRYCLAWDAGTAQIKQEDEAQDDTASGNLRFDSGEPEECL